MTLVTKVMRCPFCGQPSIEHELKPGYLHWTYTCPKAGPGWVGTFYDDPVDGESCP